MNSEVVAGKIESCILEKETAFTIKAGYSYGSKLYLPKGTKITAKENFGSDPKWSDEYPICVDTRIEYELP